MSLAQSFCNLLSVIVLIYASVNFGWKGAAIQLISSALMAMFMILDKKWHD